MVIYEDFNSYLNEMKNGRFLVDEKELLKLNIPLNGKEPIAKRKKGTNYVELYDFSDEMKFISNEELSNFHGYIGDVEMFGVSAEDFTLVGYHIHYGQFHRVYDLREAFDKLSLNLMEKEEVKYPYVNMAIFDEEELFLEKAKGHIVGFVMDGNKPFPVVDLKRMEDELNMIKFKGTEIKFPLVDKWYMQNFRYAVQYDKEQIKGYYVKYNQFRPIYHIVELLEKLPVVSFTDDYNEWEIKVPVGEYQTFDKLIPSGYQRYLMLKGLTKDGHLLFYGPETGRFKEIKEKFMNR